MLAFDCVTHMQNADVKCKMWKIWLDWMKGTCTNAVCGSVQISEPNAQML